jgi:hypothetical protein
MQAACSRHHGIGRLRRLNLLPQRDQILEEGQCRECEKFGMTAASGAPSCDRFTNQSMVDILSTSNDTRLRAQRHPIEECRSVTQHISSDSLNLL